MEKVLFEFIEKYMVLTKEEKDAIVEMQVFKYYKKGDVLLKEGQYSLDSYFVLQGCIRAFYLIDGEEKTTAFFTEMETCVPLCSKNNAPSDFNVDCLENCILVIANPDSEKKLFTDFPRFANMCRVLSEELLVKVQFNLDSFKTHTPEQRYLHMLEQRPDLIQRVPQHQLASFLGITPQSLSRIRKRLASA